MIYWVRLLLQALSASFMSDLHSSGRCQVGEAQFLQDGRTKATRTRQPQTAESSNQRLKTENLEARIM